jgi:hypothetical protein
MQNVTIINIGSGATKVCEFCGFLARGGWFQVRYPGGAGLWAFSLRHGNMEAKRGEHAKWKILAEDLEILRALAKEGGVKFTLQTPRAKRRNKPARPAESVAQRQTEMF